MKDENKREKGEDINSALLKKALGFDAKEIVEEYASDDDGEIRLSKKKITIKCVPPDVAALKMILERETPLQITPTNNLKKRNGDYLIFSANPKKRKRRKQIAKRQKIRKKK